MSGVYVIRQLLVANAAVIAIAPPARIMASAELPLNTVLPAILITQISSVPRNTVDMGSPKVRHFDRVQVSALVKAPYGTPAGTGYPGVRALLKAILAALPNQRGTIGGVFVDSIVPDAEGPDLADQETAILQGSRDFFVGWSAS